MTYRDRTPRKSQKSRPDLSSKARTWGSKISEPYHRRGAIEVTGEAVVAAGLAGAGLPVNPATVWRGGGRQSQSPQWLFDKDRVDRDVEDGHQISVPSLSSAIRAGFRADL